MIPKAFPVAISMLKTLYKGKRKIGKMTGAAGDFAAKKGHPNVAKAIYGTRQKAHKLSRGTGKYMKKNPKEASYAAGIGTVVLGSALFGDDD
tara:strand:+ start:270 stop:545 length:276 start_codon:yes stop_codon:yes gene_type:complete